MNQQQPTVPRAAPTHAPMAHFPPDGSGELLIGGMPLTRLAARVGSIPATEPVRTGRHVPATANGPLAGGGGAANSTSAADAWSVVV
jgi:hypothetical protein